MHQISTSWLQLLKPLLAAPLHSKNHANWLVFGSPAGATGPFTCLITSQGVSYKLGASSDNLIGGRVQHLSQKGMPDWQTKAIDPDAINPPKLEAALLATLCFFSLSEKLLSNNQMGLPCGRGSNILYTRESQQKKKGEIRTVLIGMPSCPSWLARHFRSISKAFHLGAV